MLISVVVAPSALRLPASARRFVKAALVSLPFAALVACSAMRTQEPTPAFVIVDVGIGGTISESSLVDALAPVRFRLLGEMHDDPAHHAIRARLVKEIAKRGLRPSVVFEQFDFEHGSGLVASQTPGATAESVATAGQLDRKGWRWPLHEPIVAAALAAHLPIRAGNLSRTTIAALTATMDAPAQAGRPRWSARLAAANWSAAQARTLTEEIVESHCNMLPKSVVPRLVLSERMRDAAMAQALVDDATSDGAILIAGDGHVRADLGVPVYLYAPGLASFDARSISVGFVEAENGASMSGDVGIARLVAEHPGFDYLVVTPDIERPDPCEEFHRRSD